MNFEAATDIAFAAAAIVPGLLAYEGQIPLALIALVVLLIAGGLYSLLDPQSPQRQRDIRVNPDADPPA